MGLLALLAARANTAPPDSPGVPDPDAGLVNLYPTATPQTVPAPIAHWDFRETEAPFSTTAATGGDLPLNPRAGKTSPVRVDSEIGHALYLNGGQDLIVPAENTGRLHIGDDGTAVSVSAWVWIGKVNQVAIAGIWGEFADPPQRQYALFYDLPAYGGAQMSCFHVSKDGAPTPGYPYSTDYSANPKKALPGRWHHFLGTYDGTQAVSYIDGIAYYHTTGATRTGDGKRNPYTFTNGLNSSPHEFAVSTGGPLIGLIKDVKVWDQALTPGHALTLAEEFTPLPPATFADGVEYELLGDYSTPDDSPGTYTFLDMPLGTPSSSRLIVAALHGDYNPPRKLVSCTIGGVEATVAQPDVDSGIAFAYATVPLGTTGSVVATWSGSTWNQYCAIFEVKGTQPTHSGVTGGRNLVSARMTSGRGGVVLGFGHLAAETASWSPYMTRLTQGPVEPGGQQYSLAVGPSHGWSYPIGMTNGIGTKPRATVAIAFDPA